MALLRNIFWLLVFLLSTLSFVVLFEKGPNNFVPNVKIQIEDFRKAVMDGINPPKTAQP
jgi:hypothetical protein